MSIRQHDFTIERRFPSVAVPDLPAFADPALKRRWFKVPDSWTDADWSLDFRVGGGELQRRAATTTDACICSAAATTTSSSRADRLRLRPAARRPPDLGLADDDRVPAREPGGQGRTRVLHRARRLLRRARGPGASASTAPACCSTGSERSSPAQGHEHDSGALFTPVRDVLLEAADRAPRARRRVRGEARRGPHRARDSCGRPRRSRCSSTTATVIPESSTIVEYLDRHGDAAADASARPQTTRCRSRIWDRVMDGYVTTPVQTIVGDALRPRGRPGPARRRPGARHARSRLHAARRQLDGRGSDGWLAGSAPSRSPTARRCRRCTTPTSSTRSTAAPSRARRLLRPPARASVARAGDRRCHARSGTSSRCRGRLTSSLTPTAHGRAASAATRTTRRWPAGCRIRRRLSSVTNP